VGRRAGAGSCVEHEVAPLEFKTPGPTSRLAARNSISDATDVVTTFEDMPSQQHLKGKLKKAFAHVISQLKQATSSRSVRSAPEPASRRTPAPTTTTTTAPPKPIFFQEGSGIQTTGTFTVPSEWALTYNYDCSSFGGTGNFIVSVYDSDGSPDDQAQGVNELGPGGNGTQNFHVDPGSSTSRVNSECNWTITVPPAGVEPMTDAKPPDRPEASRGALVSRRPSTQAQTPDVGRLEGTIHRGGHRGGRNGPS